MTLQDRFDEISARYMPLFDSLRAEGEQMERDFEKPSTVGAIIKVDIDVSWEKTDIIFDLPSVRMKRHQISFDLPEVRMNTKDMSFDTPSVKMVTKTVGKYPCFKGLKWYSCDMKMDVPEFFMERQEIRMDIPEVTMKRHELSFDLPEFFMGQINWSLHLPQFKIINVSAETQAMKDKGEGLKARADKLTAAMKTEIDTIMAGGFSEGAQALASERNAVAQPFNDAIGVLTQTINDLVAKKIDPVKVPANDGNINLRKSLEDVFEQRNAALADFDSKTAASEGAYIAAHEHESA
jgi:hypothetical protein